MMRMIEGASRSRLSWGLILGGLTMALGTAQTASASSLDMELFRIAPKILKYAESKGYTTIGTLNVRLMVGDQDAKMTGSNINHLLPRALERALVVANVRGKVEILRDPAGYASMKLPGATYRTAAGRKKLFATEFPSYTKGKVKPKAFIAGLLKIDTLKDPKNATLRLEIFTESNPVKIQTFKPMSIKTDRNLLVDSGVSFSFSRGNKLFKRGSDIIDTTDFEDVADSFDEVLDVDTKADPATDTNFPVTLKVLYDGTAKTIKRNEDNGSFGSDSFTVDTPAEGESVTFKLKNNTGERLGVVLMVNGFNSLFREDSSQMDVREMRKWIIEPNGEYSIKGFYKADMKNYDTIKGLSDSESKARWDELGTGDARGQIALYVFRKSGIPRVTTVASLSKLDDTDSLAGKNSYASLGQLTMRKMKRGIKLSRGLMAPGDTKQTNLETDSLEAMPLTDSMIIRYYKKSDDAPKDKEEDGPIDLGF